MSEIQDQNLALTVLCVPYSRDSGIHVSLCLSLSPPPLWKGPLSMRVASPRYRQKERVCVFVCVCERERERVFVCVRERVFVTAVSNAPRTRNAVKDSRW